MHLIGNQALFKNDRVNNEIAIGYQALNGINYQGFLRRQPKPSHNLR